MAWFRVYDTLIDNPKVMRLKPELFRALISLWCIAKRYGGALPRAHDVAFALRVNESKVAAWIEELKRVGLVDEAVDGTIQPHDWNEHQYESDSSTLRVKKHRLKQKSTVTSNASETPMHGNGDETLHETHQSRTEQKTEQSRAEGETAQAPPRPRAKRLPDDWFPSDEDRAFAIELGLLPAQVAIEADKFGDYWRAKSGKDATKLDWSATWRNWCRKALEMSPRVVSKTFQQQDDDRVAAAKRAIAKAFEDAA